MFKKIDTQIWVVVSLTVVGVFIWIALNSAGFSLEDQGRILDIAVSFATLIGIITGALWTYRAFIYRRIAAPRLNIDHELVCLGLSDERTLIKIFARIENVGQVSVELESWTLRAEQIFPLDATTQGMINTKTVISERDSRWNTITDKADEILTGRHFIKMVDPGEVDRAVANIVLPRSAQVIQIYSHFKARKPPESLGWPMQTVVDLRLLNKKMPSGKEFSMPGSKVWYLKDAEDSKTPHSLSVKKEPKRDRYSEGGPPRPKEPERDRSGENETTERKEPERERHENERKKDS